MLFITVTIFDRLGEANGSDLIQNRKCTAGQHRVVCSRLVVAGMGMSVASMAAVFEQVSVM